MKYTNTVIFDLDGTLLNTLWDLTEATNYALKECGYPERSYDEVRCFVGNGVEMLIRRAVPEGLEEDRIQEVLAIFKIFYLHNSKNNTKPLYAVEDDILDTIEDFNDTHNKSWKDILSYKTYYYLGDDGKFILPISTH